MSLFVSLLFVLTHIHYVERLVRAQTYSTRCWHDTRCTDIQLERRTYARWLRYRSFQLVNRNPQRSNSSRFCYVRSNVLQSKSTKQKDYSARRQTTQYSNRLVYPILSNDDRVYYVRTRYDPS